MPGDIGGDADAETGVADRWCECYHNMPRRTTKGTTSRECCLLTYIPVTSADPERHVCRTPSQTSHHISKCL